jgi:pimeloyl-ACP methyl ester carboxylesterase
MYQKRKRSALLRGLRRLAYWLVMAVFLIPMLFSRKMTAIPEEAGQSAPDIPADRLPTPHEKVEFCEPESGLRLRGIFIPGGGERAEKCAVIFCHGLGSTKAQLIDQANFVHLLGHDVLLFDMRGHGDSEGNFTSLGYFEKQDVLAACKYMEQERKARGIALYGFSMGAVAAALAATEDASVVGIIAESPYDSLENIVAYKAREHYGVPKWPLVTLSLWATEVRRNFDRREVDLTKALPLLTGKPILLVASSGDKTIPVEMTRRLKPYLGEGQEYWEVEGVEHGKIFCGEHGKEYEGRLRSLLSRCDAILSRGISAGN